MVEHRAHPGDNIGVNTSCKTSPNMMTSTASMTGVSQTLLGSISMGMVLDDLGSLEKSVV